MGKALPASERYTNEFFDSFGSAFIQALCLASPDIVFVKDLNGAFLFANSAFEQLYGYTMEQIHGKTDFDFMSEEEAAYFANRDREALAADKPTVSIAWQVNHITDDDECFETIKSPLVDRSGKVVGLLGIGRNVTQRERSEEALRQLNLQLEARIAERTHALEVSNSDLQQALETLKLAQNELVQGEHQASLGRMVAGLAHELNSPIGSAFTVGSVLAEKASSIGRVLESGQVRKSEMLKFIDSVNEGAALIAKTLGRASELISTFKQVGVDQSSMQKREFDLAETVQDVLTALAIPFKGSRIQLVSAVPQGIELNSFPGMVTQVLINLVENAKHHAFAQTTDCCVTIQAQDLDTMVSITVQDNGTGIPLEIQDKIFDPFFTTKRGLGGSGLGLSIVHNLVTQRLGGTIRLESSAGAGSRFLITIPKSV